MTAIHEDRERRADLRRTAPAAVDRSDALAEHAPGALIGLQRSAGNRAVTTMLRGAATAQRAPAAPSTAGRVAAMSPTERLVEAFQRAPIAAAVRERILSVLSPEALVAALLSFAAVFAISQLTPVGWAADLVLALSVVFVGAGLLRAAQHLVAFAGASSATSEEELDQAGQEFADAVAEIGVDAVLLLLTRKIGPSGPSGGAPPAAGPVVLMEKGGTLAVVAVNTVPAQVAAQAGIGTGALMSTASGGGGGGSDKPPEKGEQTAAERDWEKAEAEAERQRSAADPPKDTEHGLLRQLERGKLTPDELELLKQAFPRRQPDGAVVKILNKGKGSYTVVVTNAKEQSVTVIREKSKVELRGLSRNNGWDPPYD
ncbi:hypothetical protein [Actinoplanes sp. NBRC 103695]|uniref:hypothetical protein n=1 Tax=Actinoplanes sp. NBRC 103695 TaxID=3032202 RepID=UPI0024A1FF51|nr:hypothetical protein [Actinoplanes sp. NBRC 103695]GLY94015.1 hypothetical protein Acsp02_12710 [Actinoplanes sp. NBRC 103695]